MKSQLPAIKTAVIFLLFIHHCFAFPQQPIDVTENTLKIKGLSEELFYFGFAKGDLMVFNFNELNGKELKEVEITELPSSTRFREYKTNKVENKTIQVNHTGIYKFRFVNSGLMGRLCKIKIQRLPATNSTANFNCTVYSKTVTDTIDVSQTKSFKLVNDITIHNLVDQTVKVHSKLNPNSSTNCINFTLPKNTVAWSYYIGVNQQGQQAFNDALNSMTQGAAGLLFKLPNVGPLAALALYGTSYIAQLQSGDEVKYSLALLNTLDTIVSNKPPLYIKKAKVINISERMTDHLKGNYEFCLTNINIAESIIVTLKVTSISVTQKPKRNRKQKFKLIKKEIMYLKN